MWLHAGRVEQAWASYQDVLEVPAFSESGEAFAAESLFNVYASGSPDAIKKKVKDTREFQGLDAQVQGFLSHWPTHSPGNCQPLLLKRCIIKISTNVVM